MWSESVWVVAIAISAVACALVAPAATPIDRALPVIGVALTLAAWLVRETRWAAAVLCGVPLLAGCVIAFPDDGTRLAAYGLVVAITICGAILAVRTWTFQAAAGFTTIGIALLRWLGRERIEISRESIILIGAIAITAVMRSSALSVAIAIGAGFLSPAIPARTMLIPLALAAIVWIVRVRLTFAPVLAIAVMLIFFPWSGAAARAFPFFFRRQASHERLANGRALAPGESNDFEVPAGTHALVLSVANGLLFPRGMVVGTVDGTPIRMGEIADWGASRREVWWRAKVSLPRDPAGRLRSFGYDAWVDGAGRIPLTPRSHVRIAVDPALPSGAVLQVEGFEK